MREFAFISKIGVPLTNWELSSWKSMSDEDLKLFEDRVMMVFYKVVAVLNMVHDAGQIHLDLKPRNSMRCYSFRRCFLDAVFVSDISTW